MKLSCNWKIIGAKYDYVQVLSMWQAWHIDCLLSWLVPGERSMFSIDTMFKRFIIL